MTERFIGVKKMMCGSWWRYRLEIAKINMSELINPPDVIGLHQTFQIFPGKPNQTTIIEFGMPLIDGPLPILYRTTSLKIGNGHIPYELKISNTPDVSPGLCPFDPNQGYQFTSEDLNQSTRDSKRKKFPATASQYNHPVIFNCISFNPLRLVPTKIRNSLRLQIIYTNDDNPFVFESRLDPNSHGFYRFYPVDFIQQEDAPDDWNSLGVLLRFPFDLTGKIYQELNALFYLADS